MQAAVGELSRDISAKYRGDYCIEFRSMDLSDVGLVTHNYIAIVDPLGKDIVQLHGLSHDKTSGWGAMSFWRDSDRLHVMASAQNDAGFDEGLEFFVKGRVKNEEELIGHLKQLEREDINNFKADTIKTSVLATGNAYEIASMLKVMYGMAHAMNDRDMAYVSDPMRSHQNSNSVASTFAYALTGKLPEVDGLSGGVVAPGEGRILLSRDDINEMISLTLKQQEMPLGAWKQNLEDLIEGRHTYGLHWLNSHLRLPEDEKTGNMIENDGREIVGPDAKDVLPARTTFAKRIVEKDEVEYDVEGNIPYSVDDEMFYTNNGITYTNGKPDATTGSLDNYLQNAQP